MYLYHKNKCVARQNRKINKSSPDIYMSVCLNVRAYIRCGCNNNTSGFRAFFLFSFEEKFIEISRQFNSIKSSIKQQIHPIHFCCIPMEIHSFPNFFYFSLKLKNLGNCTTSPWGCIRKNQFDPSAAKLCPAEAICERTSIEEIENFSI